MQPVPGVQPAQPVQPPMPDMPAQQPPVPNASPAREVGTLRQELVTYPLQDIVAGLQYFFHLDTLMTPTASDDPTTAARKRQAHARYQQLTQEQQAIAQQRMQAWQQRKAAELEAAQAAAAQPGAPGMLQTGQSSRQQAVQRLQDDRQKMGGSSGAG